jgi:hypothetical protein
MYGKPGPPAPDYAIFMRLMAWWDRYSLLDNLGKHSHFECCIYPFLTEVMGLPTSEESDLAVAEAIAKAGVPIDRKREKDLFRELSLEVFQELQVNKQNGLVRRQNDGSFAYNVHALRDFIEKHRARVMPLQYGPLKTASLDGLGGEDAGRPLETIAANTQSPEETIANVEAKKAFEEAVCAVAAVAKARRALKSGSKDLLAIRKYMEALVAKRISLAEVARLEGCNPGNLTRAYAQEVQEGYQGLPEMQLLRRSV